MQQKFIERKSSVLYSEYISLTFILLSSSTIYFFFLWRRVVELVTRVLCEFVIFHPLLCLLLCILSLSTLPAIQLPRISPYLPRFTFLCVYHFHLQRQYSFRWNTICILQTVVTLALVWNLHSYGNAGNSKCVGATGETKKTCIVAYTYKIRLAQPKLTRKKEQRRKKNPG